MLEDNDKSSGFEEGSMSMKRSWVIGESFDFEMDSEIVPL